MIDKDRVVNRDTIILTCRIHTTRLSAYICPSVGCSGRAGAICTVSASSDGVIACKRLQRSS